MEQGLGLEEAIERMVKSRAEEEAKHPFIEAGKEKKKSRDKRTKAAPPMPRHCCSTRKTLPTTSLIR